MKNVENAIGRNTVGLIELRQREWRRTLDMVGGDRAGAIELDALDYLTAAADLLVETAVEAVR